MYMYTYIYIYISFSLYTVPALAKGVTQKAQNIKGAKVKLGEGAKIRRKRKSYLNR